MIFLRNSHDGLIQKAFSLLYKELEGVCVITKG